MGSVSHLHLAPVLERLTKSEASYDNKRLARAYAAARSAYADDPHWTGESILDHCLGTLEELSVFEPDEDTAIACMLHHVLDVDGMSLVDIEEQFGPKVRTLVSGIHLLSHVTLEGRRRSIEDLRVMLLSVSDDVRVLFVALCDRAHCLTRIEHVEHTRAKRLCQDVLQLFAPVAARLGIYSLKHQLESGAFPIMYPTDSENIGMQLDRVHKERPDFLEKAMETLALFLKEQGITASIESREKQPFSVFQKMHRKSLTAIETIYDLYAVRVVVKNEEDCYRVLGLLHQLGRPMPNRFKDYIAFPKPNGYQSLHTTLAGLEGVSDAFVEIQVRTDKMHREAMFGIAAHWSYKEHGATERALEKVQLHSLLVAQESIDHGNDTGPSLADHIFVLTPRGDIIELPEGATPLDFAFQVHTDLGLSFRNARVNGSIVPLDYQLENGDVIEIMKHNNPQPSTKWMQLLKMASSRSKLRRYLYAQDRPNLVAMGKDMVNAELKKRGLPQLTTDLSILRVCDGETMNQNQREDLLMKIGQSSERASSLLLRLKALESENIALEKSQRKGPVRLQRKDAEVAMEGGLQMPLRYAKCCSPNTSPREEIAGNINREGEVMVHRAPCKMFANTNPERRINVWWK